MQDTKEPLIPSINKEEDQETRQAEASQPLQLGMKTDEEMNEPFLPLGHMGVDDDSPRRREAAKASKWAYVSMTVAAFCFFASCFCVKAAYEWYNVTTYDVVLVRVLSLAIFILIYSAIARQNPCHVPVEEVKFLVLRCIAGMGSMFAYFYGLKILPLGKAELIFNVNPIFTAILCNIFLRESLPRYDLISAIAAFIGIYLVSFSNYETQESDQFTGIFIVLIAAIAASISNTLTRKMSKSVYFLTGSFYFSIVSSIACIIPVAAGQPSKVYTFARMELGCVLLLCLLAVFAFVGQLLMNLSFKLEEGRKVSSIKYTQVVYAFLADYLVFGTMVIATDLVGAGLILGTFMVIAILRCSGKIR